MPAAVAIPAIVGALGVGSSVYGTAKQAGAAKRASQEQERSRQEALAYEREQARRADQRRRQQWNQYQQAYQTWYSRYGDRGIDRYGVPIGVKYGPTATPGAAGAPGTPGTPVPGATRAPVTLAGGRQVDPDEYNRYVQQREARRGRTLGQMVQG